MPLTPDEKHLFEQLGRNPVFRAWLSKEKAEQDKVLKNALATELIFRAQGAANLVDRIEGALGTKQ